MRFGVHLPLMDFGDQRFAVDRLEEYVETATALGFDAVSVNDHMVFGVPWLDGPTALAAVVSCSGDARLFTTVANPVVRGPAALAKVLAGLDVLSGGRVTAGLGPGSSARDYATVGVPFEERWPRFDEAVLAMRALLSGGSFTGRFYAVDGRPCGRRDRLDAAPADRPRAARPATADVRQIAARVARRIVRVALTESCWPATWKMSVPKASSRGSSSIHARGRKSGCASISRARTGSAFRRSSRALGSAIAPLRRSLASAAVR